MDAASPHRRRRHPRADRRRALPPGRGALQGLHHRRSAHAVEARLQRAAEDAGGAAAAREVHLRHHRDPQGAGDHPVALPALRPAPRRGRRCWSKHSTAIAAAEGVAVEPDGAGADRARRRRLGARRAVAARPGDRACEGETGWTRRRSATCWAWPTAAACSICSKPLMRGRRRATRWTSGPTLYRSGADPVGGASGPAGLHPLADAAQGRAGNARSTTGTPEAERVRGGELSAQAVACRSLTRAWQMLLKGLGEVQSAPVPFACRRDGDRPAGLCRRAADPADLIRQLQGSGAPAGGGTPAGQNGSGGGGARRDGAGTGGRPGAAAARMEPAAQPVAAAGRAPMRDAEPLPDPKTFREVVALFGEMREGSLYGQLYSSVHCVRIRARPAGDPTEGARRRRNCRAASASC